MSTKNFTSFLCSFLFLSLIISCNVIQEVTGGKTDFGDFGRRGNHDNHHHHHEHLSDPYYVVFSVIEDVNVYFYYLNTENGEYGPMKGEDGADLEWNNASGFTYFDGRIFYTDFEDNSYYLYSYDPSIKAGYQHFEIGGDSNPPLTVHEGRLYFYNNEGMGSLCYLESAGATSVCDLELEFSLTMKWLHFAPNGDIFACVEDSGYSLYLYKVNKVNEIDVMEKVQAEISPGELSPVPCNSSKPYTALGQFLNVPNTDELEIYNPTENTLKKQSLPLTGATIDSISELGDVYLRGQMGSTIRYSLSLDSLTDTGIELYSFIEGARETFFVEHQEYSYVLKRMPNGGDVFADTYTQIASLGTVPWLLASGPDSLFYFSYEGIYRVSLDGTYEVVSASGPLYSIYGALNKI